MFGPIMSLVIFLPFVFIIWLANVADSRRMRGQPSPGLAALTYIFLAGGYLAMAAIGALFAVLAALPVSSTAQAARPLRGDIASPELLALGLIVPSALAMLLLLRPVRALFGFVLPLDPRSTVHAVALSYTMLVAINLLTILGMGIDNLAASLGAAAPGAPDPGTLYGLWAQELAWALLGMVGVGLLSRRGPLAVLERLGIVPPSLTQILVGIGAGIGLALVALAILNLSISIGVPMDEGVRKLSERLLGPLGRTVPGILTLGLAAALGEETLFRGALQPRFGLVFTSLLFALLHSTYGLSLYTVVVLIIGLVLGVLRQRFNTSTSMVTHATYNIFQAVLDLLTG